MVKLSIIIVNYHSEYLVKRLKQSITSKFPYEVIVINNTHNNRGFAKACNEGAKKAKGEFLLFLNPDSVVMPQALELMLKKISSDKRIGILGPQLLDGKMNPYTSFSRQPSKLAAPFYLSFLNTLIPNNSYSNYYEYKNYPLEKEGQVESISGAAMMMRKSVFKNIGGFDERYFLYWEDFDISKKVTEAGYKIWYLPSAKIVHYGGQSSNNNRIAARDAFRKSRFAFFRKYHGTPYALFLETWLTVGEEWRLVLIILLAAFLRFDRIHELMPIIGDQGRDFLAALEALETKTVPLLGIPSSVPRFHQGPLSIWLFSAVFGIFGTDPVYAGYLAAIIGLLAVAGTYILLERHAGTLAAIVASLFLATSPLAVTQSRMAFHTNPIPLMSVLFLWRLWKNPTKPSDLYLAGLFFSLLFQFELAVVPLILLVFSYAWKQPYWKYAILGVLSGLIPQIVYDLTHGFKQLGLFGVWLGYRLASFVGFDAEHAVSQNKLSLVLSRFLEYGERFFSNDPYLFMLLGLTFILWIGNRMRLFFYLKRYERYTYGWILLLIAGYVVHGGPSEAYFPAFFVPVSICLGLIAGALPLIMKRVYLAVIFFVIITNVLSLYQSEYFHWKYSAPLKTQSSIIHHIAEVVQGNNVIFEAVGPGSEHQSAVDNYRFLWKLHQNDWSDQPSVRVTIFLDNKHYIIPDSKVYFNDGYGYAIATTYDK